MISQLREPCRVPVPHSDTSPHYPGEARARAAAAPGPGMTHPGTAVLAAPCWIATCDHPGCGAPFLEDGDPDGSAVMHAPDETALRAWLTAGGWVYGPGGRSWCHEHRADQSILEAAVTVTRHAARFAGIERSVVTLPDGTPETDSDHTVHLSWLAPALAAATQPGLDPHLVASFAAIHDAVEVHAGDTPTITITADARARKKEREDAAAWLWHDELAAQLAWLPAMIQRYASQSDPEARFTRAVDKLAPKLLHLVNEAGDLHAAGVTPGEFTAMVREQRASFGTYAAEFAGLLSLYDQVTAAVTEALSGLAGGTRISHRAVSQLSACGRCGGPRKRTRPAGRSPG